MPLTYTRNFETIGKTFQGNFQRFEIEIRAALDAGIELAKNRGKGYISSRGTEKSGKAGRVETGNMLQSFDGAVTNGRNEISGEVGWLDELPDYAIFQEYGTQFVSAMYALRDASEEGWAEFTRLADIALERLVRG